MTAKELYEWCVENKCEDLEIIISDNAFDICTVYPIKKQKIRIVKERLWKDKPKQECLFLR